jgi:hypothetical protein
VTEFMFAATIGSVAPVPSPGARSTSRRLVTPERLGTRKTSEYVRSCGGTGVEKCMDSRYGQEGPNFRCAGCRAARDTQAE